MQRCAHMLRSRRLRSHKRPWQTLPLCSEAHQKHRTRLRDSELPTNDRSARNARGTHRHTASASTQRGGWIFGPESPVSTVSDCSRDQHPTQKRLAEAETPNPDEAQSHSQVVVLAGIDLRSQHGQLVSARVSASLRKGVLGVCNRAASQATSGGQGLPDRAGCCRGAGHDERGGES